MMKLKAIWFAVLSITVFFPGMPSRAENPIKASPDRFSIAVECVKRFEGWHGEKKHWPYVGWGHKVLPGERFTNSITKAQGDSILRADLRKLLHLPLNAERLRKLTENYVVSNAKIKAALGIDRMPVRAEEGIVRTIKSFSNIKVNN